MFSLLNYPSTNKKIKLPSHFTIAWIIIFVSFLLKAFYIFKFTYYEHSVLCDMSAFWDGAFQRLSGDDHNVAQYAIFPTFYIFFLTGFLQIIKNVGLISHALNIAILFNLLLSSISAYVVFLIVDHLVNRKIFSLIALTFYAFSYTIMYLNALILPENLGIPLLIIAIGLIILRKMDWKNVSLVGFLVGIVVAAKPMLLFLSLSFIYYIFYLSIKRSQYWKIALFLAAFLIVPVSVIYENYNISNGKLFGFGAYGGANFYASWAHLKSVRSNNPTQGAWWISFPTTDGIPNLKDFYTDQPFYNQNYFYSLGFKTIINNPIVLIKKLSWSDKFFFGDLYPTHVVQPYGYKFLKILPPFILFGMFLTIGIFIIFLSKYPKENVILFLYSVFIFFFSGMYLVGTFDRRYLSFIEFLIIILFFTTLEKIYTFYKLPVTKNTFR